VSLVPSAIESPAHGRLHVAGHPPKVTRRRTSGLSHFSQSLSIGRKEAAELAAFAELLKFAAPAFGATFQPARRMTNPHRETAGSRDPVY
jgi:hypothetical protein